MVDEFFLVYYIFCKHMVVLKKNFKVEGNLVFVYLILYIYISIAYYLLEHS